MAPLAVAATCPDAATQEAAPVHAAGSLQAAVHELGKPFEAQTQWTVTF